MSNTVPLIQVSLEKMVKAYVKIRERRSEIKREFDEKDADLVSQLDVIRGALLDHCEAHNVTSVKTSEGLFYRTVTQKYWTSNWDEMHKFIIEHKEPALLDKRINQKNIKEFLEENPKLLPKGLNSNSTYSISVRRK
mgnify:FL=1|jgi:hypothetical protein|tara:strand:+ start:97 stop:507 length:411 start_codon:yes stop_codon:yes gene_type:complete